MPGRRSRYGVSHLWRWRKVTRGPGPALRSQNGLPLLDVVLVVEGLARERVHLGEHLVGREDQRVLRGLRIRLRELLAGALDGRHVVHVRRDLGLDLGVVDEVHVRRRGGARALERDEHVVRPDHRALLRDRPLELRVRGEQLHDVARPGHGRGEVALGEWLRVVVAGEPPDLAVVDRLLDAADRLVERLVRDDRRVVAAVEHHEPHRVGHLGQHRDLALELRVLEELLDRRHRPRDVLVPRDAGHTRLPRKAVRPVGVERRALLRVDEVRDVRDLVLVEWLDPLLAHEELRVPRAVREDEDVAVDPTTLRQRALDLREVRRVVVDVLEVVDLDAGLLGELVERRVLLRLLVVVDVERPVREAEHVRDLAAPTSPARRPAAGGEQPRKAQDRDAGRTALNEFPPGDPHGHSACSSPRSTTNVASGAHDRVTWLPGAGATPPASTFWWNTDISPTDVATTTSVATPMYADSFTFPESRLTPPSRRLIFSGRTPIDTGPCEPFVDARSSEPSTSRITPSPVIVPSSRFDLPRKPATNAVRGLS